MTPMWSTGADTARRAGLSSSVSSALPARLLSEIERRSPDVLEQITVIDFNPLVFRTLTDRGMHVVYGDISNVDTLVHAGVGKSELIILSIPDSLLKGADNEKLVRHVRSLNPTAKIVATAEILAEVDDLYAAGADYVTVTRLSDADELYQGDRGGAGRASGRQARRDRRAAPASAARCCRNRRPSRRFRAPSTRSSKQLRNRRSPFGNPRRLRSLHIPA